MSGTDDTYLFDARLPKQGKCACGCGASVTPYEVVCWRCRLNGGPPKKETP